jgi:hypothetical protein
MKWTPDTIEAVHRLGRTHTSLEVAEFLDITSAALDSARDRFGFKFLRMTPGPAPKDGMLQSVTFDPSSPLSRELRKEIARAKADRFALPLRTSVTF